jgi:ankyrin repeat protein
MPSDVPGEAVQRSETAEGVLLCGDDPLAVALGGAIRGGDLASVRALVEQYPHVASARIDGRDGGTWRTSLHIAADWPGYFPNAPAAVALLAGAGADPNAGTGGRQPETPLHWAASSDDLDVAVALIDAGARLDTPGGSIGTPLDNAVGYGCWQVARLLVQRGAPVEKLWHASALGLLSRVEEFLAATPSPTAEAVTEAFWQACSGGQLRAADLLLAAGADINGIPGYSAKSAVDVAAGPDTRRGLLVGWLRERGATSAD